MGSGILRPGLNGAIRRLSGSAALPVFEFGATGAYSRVLAMTTVTVAVSVPLFHIYVDVGLSGFELAIHTLVIFLCAILAWKIIWEVGHFIEARRESQHLKAGVYWLLAIVFLPIIFAGASYFQDAFAVTSSILAKHQSAGYERTLFLVVPFVLFPVWLIFQSGRLRMVRSSVPAPTTREHGADDAEASPRRTAECRVRTNASMLSGQYHLRGGSGRQTHRSLPALEIQHTNSGQQGA